MAGGDSTGGGSTLYGAPWWVGLIGIVMAFAAVGLTRLWWHVRMTYVVRKSARERRRRNESKRSP